MPFKLMMNVKAFGSSYGEITGLIPSLFTPSWSAFAASSTVTWSSTSRQTPADLPACADPKLSYPGMAVRFGGESSRSIVKAGFGDMVGF